jgi:hypothetical protein
MRAAELFDIYLTRPAPDLVHFKVYDKGGWREFDLPASIAMIRLATELCSKTLRWVYYRPDRCCVDTFLALSDRKIRRLGELYQRWKAAGFPER